LFGPVPSRRLGRSLGVDLNPMKVCSEDCVFCQVGRTTEKTMARREWVPMGEVRAEWKRWLAEGGEADYVTLSGSGEPTLHVRFGEMLDWAHEAGFRAAVLSNGSMMGDAAVRREAARADVVKVTISAWDEASFARMHRPAAGLTFAGMMEGIRRFRGEFAGKLWVETMVLPGYNDGEGQVRAMAARVAEVGADAVHLNTVTRPSLSGEPGEPLHPESAAWLHHVAGWFTPRAEIPVFKGHIKPVSAMDDDAICELIARHPLQVEALAAAGGESAAAVEARVAGLVAAGRLRMEVVEGARTVLPGEG
jgi:wyosine [tRNA(Phe)-imidazoG37] synthetase (radical SAM superfamily)